MILCRAPKENLVDAISFADKIRVKHKDKAYTDVILGARAEHAVADLLGDAAFATCLDQQHGDVATDYDVAHVQQNGRTRHIDIKAKWLVSESNLSSHKYQDVDYVFVYPFDKSVGVLDNVDLVFVVAGWCPGSVLTQAPPHVRATYWCPPELLRPIREVL